MKAAKARATADAGEEPPREKSLQELMRDAKEKQEPPAAEPPREKSLQELMQEAKQKQAAEPAPE
jgi:HEPN domain-containing protein